MFKKFHYLSHEHHKAAEVFVSTVNDVVCGFISVHHFPHPNVKNMKKVHRLVVTPDFQGIGLSKHLLNFVGEKYTKENYRLRIITSNPALKGVLKNNNWHLKNQGRNKAQSSRSTVGNMNTSTNRFTTSWEYILPSGKASVN